MDFDPRSMEFNPAIIKPAITRMWPYEDMKIIEVDTKKATYRGDKWSTLGEFARRKFENLIVLKNPMEKVKVVYK